MKFEETPIQGAWVINLEKKEDERGYFARLWCESELLARGLTAAHAQVNTTVNPRAGTLRGMHFQIAPYAEVKIVRCVRGAAFDVIVDLRAESPTFRKWFGLTLSPRSDDMLYVPEGCAHGYLTMLDDTEVLYFTSQTYSANAARGLRHDDSAFQIRWPQPINFISIADQSWPEFSVSKEGNL